MVEWKAVEMDESWVDWTVRGWDAWKERKGVVLMAAAMAEWKGVWLVAHLDAHKVAKLVVFSVDAKGK